MFLPWRADLPSRMPGRRSQAGFSRWHRAETGHGIDLEAASAYEKGLRDP
jgi:hypothetical protein